jgi:hypothetical protein
MAQEQPVELIVLRRRLEAVESLRREKGLLPSDLRGHAALMIEARRSLEWEDMEAARSAIATMEVRLEKVAVDSEFVGAKMLRMRKLSRSIEARDQVEEIFSSVRDRVAADDYAGANAYLNELLPLIEETL